MLWFKFILGLKVFELVSIIFAIVPDYGRAGYQVPIFPIFWPRAVPPIFSYFFMKFLVFPIFLGFY